jgi:hypothetical protein
MPLLFSETSCGKILMATWEFTDTQLFANTWEHLVSWRRLLGQVIISIIVLLDAFCIILLDNLQDSLVDWSSSLWVRTFFTLNWFLFWLLLDEVIISIIVLRCVLHHCAGYFARPLVDWCSSWWVTTFITLDWFLLWLFIINKFQQC